MKKLLLSLVLSIVALASLSAQGLGIRVEGGVNVEHLSTNIKDLKTNAGYRLGVGLELSMASPLYFATGLNYRQGEMKLSGVKEDVRSLSLPVHLGVRFALGGVGLSAEGGVFGRYRLSSDFSGGVCSDVSNAVQDVVRFSSERFDYGVSGSVAGHLGKLYLRVGTEYGLKDVFKGEGFSLKGHSYYATLGLRF